MADDSYDSKLESSIRRASLVSYPPRYDGSSIVKIKRMYDPVGDFIHINANINYAGINSPEKRNDAFKNLAKCIVKNAHPDDVNRTKLDVDKITLDGLKDVHKYDKFSNMEKKDGFDRNLNALVFTGIGVLGGGAVGLGAIMMGYDDASAINNAIYVGVTGGVGSLVFNTVKNKMIDARENLYNSLDTIIDANNLK